MTTYELTLILPTDREKAVFDRVKKVLDTAGAKITNNDEWGKRTLAYPINKKTEGVYYSLTIDMDTDKTQAFNRILENDDDIIRHLIVVAAKKVQENSSSSSTSTRKEKTVGAKSTKSTKSIKSIKGKAKVKN